MCNCNLTTLFTLMILDFNFKHVKDPMIPMKHAEIRHAYTIASLYFLTEGFSTLPSNLVQ